MKTLVGSDAYVGYIQSIHEGEPCEISVKFYEANRDSLKYALLQVFPNLTIEVVDQDWDFYLNGKNGYISKIV